MEPLINNAKNLKTVRITAKYQMIVKALQQANFNKTKAAIILNIDRKTLYNIMEQYKMLTI